MENSSHFRLAGIAPLILLPAVIAVHVEAERLLVLRCANGNPAPEANGVQEALHSIQSGLFIGSRCVMLIGLCGKRGKLCCVRICSM